MKSLKEYIREGIFDEKFEKDIEFQIIADNLLDRSSEKRLAGVTTLKLLVESYKPRRVKQLSNLKDVKGYVVEFSSGDSDYDTVRMSRKDGESCYTITFFGKRSSLTNTCNYWGWGDVKSKYNPKNNLLYIVPKELDTLFDFIYKAYENWRMRY